jgi:RNA polymerase sigma-70 factor (ECF subfamily)
LDATELNAALDGDGHAMRQLVDLLTPVIHARAARALLKNPKRQQRDVANDVRDLVQDTFAMLFDNNARVLRTWREGGGLSLKNYAGLIAGRHINAMLRTGKRNPYENVPVVDEHLDALLGDGDACHLERATDARDIWTKLLDRLRDHLSAQGWHLFELLVVCERPTGEIEAITGLSRDAIYAWKSRLRRLCRSQLQRIVSEPPRSPPIRG